MARVAGPLDPRVPGFVVQGIPLLVPIDLPEGGYLQVVVGENPMTLPTPSLQLAKGCMVAIIPAEVATLLRPNLDREAAKLKNPNRDLPLT